MPYLSPDEREVCRDKGILKKVGFRMEVNDTELEEVLSENAAKLKSRPIKDWPKATARLNKSTVDVQFDFMPIDEDIEASSYKRTIELFDPTGEAFKGRHDDSPAILAELKLCDIGIVFLPADEIINAMDANSDIIDDDRLLEIMDSLILGQTTQLLKAMNRTILGNDIFPVCFVISKSDLIPKSKFASINKLILDRIISRFSRDNKRFVVCTCPISIMNAATGNFQGINLEWPFLFAAGGTIFRNSLELMKAAEQDQSRARAADSDADRLEALYNRSKWSYFWNWWSKSESFVSERRVARSYFNNAGRKIDEAADDKSLAADIWSSIATEGPNRGVWVFMAGEKINISDIV